MYRASENRNGFVQITDCGNKLLTVGKMHMSFLATLNFPLFAGYKERVLCKHKDS